MTETTAVGTAQSSTNAAQTLTMQRPSVSPYGSRPVALCVGSRRKEYYVSSDLLQNPDWINSANSLRDIHVPDVDESTGHVLVHFLYTGTYQTLDNMDVSPIDKINIEFKRAISAYLVAHTYELAELQQLAMRKIEQCGISMTIFDIVNAIDKNFSRLLNSTTWFRDYLTSKARRTFQEDYTAFSNHGLFDRITDVTISNTLAKCVMGLYNDKVSHMLQTERAVQEDPTRRDDTTDREVDKTGEDGEEEKTDILIWGSGRVEGETRNDSKREQNEDDEAESRRKDDNEAEQANKMEEECASAAILAAKVIDLVSQVDDVKVDDCPRTSTVVRKKGKKGKKGKVIDASTPPAISGTTFDDNNFDNSTSDVLNIDRNINYVEDAKIPGTHPGGFGGGPSPYVAQVSPWSIGYAHEKPKNQNETTKFQLWDSSTAGKSEQSGFNSNIDALHAAPAELVSIPLVEEKIHEDDPWSFTFGSEPKKKSKKGAKVIVEEVEPIPAPEPEKLVEGEDLRAIPIFGSTKSNKKNKKGAALVEETPAELDPEPAPKLTPPLHAEALREDSGWVSSYFPTGKEKKVNGSLIKDFKGESISADPQPQLHEPIALAGDEWGSTAPVIKKKKKGKKAATTDPIVEDLPPSPLKSEPQPRLEPAKEKCPVEPFVDTAVEHENPGKELQGGAEEIQRDNGNEKPLDPWDPCGTATSKDKKKPKKAKKSMSNIGDPSLSQVEPAPAPAIDEDTRDKWDNRDNAMIRDGQKEEDCRKGADVVVPGRPEEEPVIEPQRSSEPVFEGKQNDGGDVPPSSSTLVLPTALNGLPETGNDDSEDWGFRSMLGGSSKRKKKGKPTVIKPVPEPVIEDSTLNQALDKFVGSRGEKSEYKVRAEEEPTVERLRADDEVAVEPVPAEPSMFSFDRVLNPETPKEIKASAEAESGSCPVRVKHLLEGDGLKSCRICQAWLRDILVRTSSFDYDGYEIVH